MRGAPLRRYSGVLGDITQSSTVDSGGDQLDRKELGKESEGKRYTRPVKSQARSPGKRAICDLMVRVIALGGWVCLDTR